MKEFLAGVTEQPDVKTAVEWGCALGRASVPKAVYSEEFWKAYRTILDQYAITDVEYEELQGWSEYEEINMLTVDAGTMATLISRAGAEMLYEEEEACPALVVKGCELSTLNTNYGANRRADYKICAVETVADLQKGEKMIKDVAEFHSENMWIIVGPEVAKKMDAAVFGMTLFSYRMEKRKIYLSIYGRKVYNRGINIRR